MENLNEMTAERSLEIIRKHLDQSRKELTKNAGTPMIWWGSLVFVTALIVGHLWKATGNPSWNFLWFIMAIIGYAGNYLMDKKEKQAHVPQTFISKMISHVWLAFGTFAVTMAVLLFVVAQSLGYFTPLLNHYTVIIILMVCLCCTITGLILKNLWIALGGFLGGMIGAAVADVMVTGYYQMMAMAGVALVALIIPGIIINLKSRKDA